MVNWVVEERVPIYMDAVNPELAARGELLGHRYRLHEAIGHGGMSVVYRAYDLVLDRTVAVKMMAQVGDPKLRAKLQAEARAYGRINHSRIAQVFDYGETDRPGGPPAPYIVMELVEGDSLSSRLADGTALPWRSATVIAAQIAQALAAAHARGLVHRDIKPGNVIITDIGVKLVDFGISAAIGAPEADDDGEVLGTPSYVAPERITNVPVGPAADVYSLGVLLYRMLAGTMPWTVDSRTQQLAAHMFVDAAPLPPIASLPDDVAQLCATCLAKDPNQRPTSADVATILDRVVAGQTSSADVPVPAFVPGVTAARDNRTRSLGDTYSPMVRLRRRRPALVLALALAAVSAALLVTVWTTGGTAPRVNSADAASCDSTFSVVRDGGSDFTANVTVTNTSAVPLHGWRLAFALPGRQTLEPNGDGTTVTPEDGSPYVVTVTQSGSNVLAVAGADHVLASGARAVLPLSARYAGSNLLPTTFTLNGATCRTQVAGAVSTSPAAVGPTLVPRSTAAKTDDGGHGHGHGNGGSGGGGDGDGNGGPGKG